MFSIKEKESINKIIQTVVNTTIFQRLNYIKQLGNLYKIFPGVTHTRFLHSLGVFHLAKFTLLANKFIKWTNKEAILFLFASLLHDIGHGPLSHSFEELVNFTNDSKMKWHEKNTCQIIKYDKELNNALKPFSWLKESLNILFENKFNESSFNNDDINYKKVKQMISSEFDVDRLDYLYRDVYFAGTKYIFGEGELLLENVKFDEKESHIHFDKRWEGTIQYYLHTRFHLHEVLYGHEESALYDALLFAIGNLIKSDKVKINTMLKLYLKDIISYNKNFLTFTDATFEFELSRILKVLSNKPNFNFNEKLLLILLQSFIKRNIKFKLSYFINEEKEKIPFNPIFFEKGFRFHYSLMSSLWYKDVTPININDEKKIKKIESSYVKRHKVMVIEGKWK